MSIFDSFVCFPICLAVSLSAHRQDPSLSTPVLLSTFLLASFINNSAGATLPSDINLCLKDSRNLTSSWCSASSVNLISPAGCSFSLHCMFPVDPSYVGFAWNIAVNSPEGSKFHYAIGLTSNGYSWLSGIEIPFNNCPDGSGCVSRSSTELSVHDSSHPNIWVQFGVKNLNWRYNGTLTVHQLQLTPFCKTPFNITDTGCKAYNTSENLVCSTARSTSKGWDLCWSRVGSSSGTVEMIRV